MKDRNYSQLCELIMNTTNLGRTVILPDFFVDRFVKFESLKDIFERLKVKVEYGGGSIHGIEQFECKGGNAVNIAYALGRLGVETTLITLADDQTSPLLLKTFSELQNVELRIIDGKPGYTVALEFKEAGRLVNVMLSDVGDIARFHPSLLSDYEFNKICEAKMVVVTNWAANYNFGTELALKVFEFGKGAGVRTLFAPADFTTRLSDFRGVIDSILKKGLVDVLSINENEASGLAKLMNIAPLPSRFTELDVERVAKNLSLHLNTIVDLHTSICSATSDGKDAICVPCFKVDQRVSTGAGDVWDAGNIYGYLANFKAKERLIFANACGA
ncbi:MAG: PfkB family carbohydrate kinase, partial [Nitrososphaerales archaeon]|nr:PfkB family carbohydrate kinase [Nitrososphaerales archaeon]